MKNKDAEKYNPCLKEMELTYKCFNDNNFDKSLCVLQMENYKTCKGFWHSVQAQRRKDGIQPYLPPVEERDQIKRDYLNSFKK
ncbi:coiled-coil-helix-coiled-coil-helix domain-containing protein 7 [Aethina tumida]|uniref:coiled-coil-helix-coiled-coil-helix domain-containing protein 7 n=1 Tax=Aethina tumida TaxID=116153 RepID=UPI00096B4DA7|nr:coiled-coil-helix-coiled-coil-helix domain-containing protein 7 [Aethina tumida]